MPEKRKYLEFSSDLISHIESKCACHSIVLYGSWARDQANASSDIDLLCVTETGEFYRDASDWENKPLDIFVYSEENLPPPGDMLHIGDGIILKDSKKFIAKFLDEVKEQLKLPPKKLEIWEKEHRVSWIRKMHKRSLRSDIEGNYRRHWLLTDLIENWFDFRNIRYQGPKKSFEILEHTYPETYHLFESALDRNSGDDKLEDLVKHVISQAEA